MRSCLGAATRATASRERRLATSRDVCAAVLELRQRASVEQRFHDIGLATYAQLSWSCDTETFEGHTNFPYSRDVCAAVLELRRRCGLATGGVRRLATYAQLSWSCDARVQLDEGKPVQARDVCAAVLELRRPQRRLRQAPRRPSRRMRSCLGAATPLRPRSLSRRRRSRRMRSCLGAATSSRRENRTSRRPSSRRMRSCLGAATGPLDCRADGRFILATYAQLSWSCDLRSFGVHVCTAAARDVCAAVLELRHRLSALALGGGHGPRDVCAAVLELRRARKDTRARTRENSRRMRSCLGAATRVAAVHRVPGLGARDVCAAVLELRRYPQFRESPRPCLATYAQLSWSCDPLAGTSVFMYAGSRRMRSCLGAATGCPHCTPLKRAEARDVCAAVLELRQRGYALPTTRMRSCLGAATTASNTASRTSRPLATYAQLSWSCDSGKAATHLSYGVCSRRMRSCLGAAT